MKAEASFVYATSLPLFKFVSESHGFGFNITGRETAKGLRLFYVGTVKPDGPAFGILRTGDRLLEVFYQLSHVFQVV